MFLLICLIFIHIINSGIFVYKKGAINFQVSRAKLRCYKNQVDDLGECTSFRVLSIKSMTRNLNVFETLYNICHCAFTESDKPTIIPRFYLKKINDKIYFQMYDEVDEDKWIEQPNCSVSAYKCILNKHRLS